MVMQANKRYKQKYSPRSGYFADVTGCEDSITGEIVAFKQLKIEHENNANYVLRFRREVELLERLAPHQNIVTVLDKGLDDGCNWYVMPYASSNLEDYLQRNNSKISLQSRIALFDAVLAAITHAHQNSVLHRDLGPKNILLFLLADSSFQVKVADFGLGKNWESLSAHTKTAQGNYGQLSFTAPEQMESLTQATVRSEIFSLGKVLNYICTGRSPRTYQICDFGPVIIKATENLPEDRYADIEAFTDAYNSLKEMLSRSDELTVGERVSAYADGSTPIDWHDFHRFAIAGEYTFHVYHDYLEPIARILNNDENVQAYYSVVGNSIGAFVKVYIERVEECLGTTRWPFEGANDFGRVLDRVYRTVSSSDLRINCLRELWRLAYESDRWAVRSLIEKIFKSGILPDDRETSVMEIVNSSTARLTIIQLRALLAPTLPRRIQQVLRDKSN